jgi:CRP-like cAMP-binding protein
LNGAEIIEAPVGTLLASEGERTSLFQIVLEGEIRATRVYDRQTILLGITKTGSFVGETMLLLEIPWLATLRVSKPARLLRLNEATGCATSKAIPSSAKNSSPSAPWPPDWRTN